MWLICKVSLEYPDLPPELSIEAVKGLSKKQCDDLLEIANRTAVENLGMPSIFTIAEAVREWLVDNNIAGQDGSMYADMMRRMVQKGADVKKKEIKMAIAQAADSEVQAVRMHPRFSIS